MNKTDLITYVANTTDMTKKSAALVVNAVFQGINDCLAEDGKVVVTGFGTFEVRERAAREGRNPKTGEAITIPAHKAVTFKAGKGLRDCAN